MERLFPPEPYLDVIDPLSAFLGAGNGTMRYTFADAVKLAGHACPTVAGAFLMARHGMMRLFPDELPRRGEVEVIAAGAVDAGVNGPIGQVVTLLTGAAATNGFAGLGGRFVRKGLLRYGGESQGLSGWLFHRPATGVRIRLTFSAQAFPLDAEVAALMPRLLAGEGDPLLETRFRDGWRNRVVAMLADAGRQTVRELP
ncbi:MAG: hypothetical protein HQL56_13835 [Magnetococcales bacterium]|nr:hypothetical protein [Magnetococcales bacterium]